MTGDERGQGSLQDTLQGILQGTLPRTVEPGTTKLRTAELRTAKAGFDLVVVCAKCAKRQGLSKREAGRRLKGALKRAHPARKVRVVAAGCLGPCPKRLIAVATPASLSARRLILLDPGLAPEAVAGLLPESDRKA